jgi:hypothetical protein
MLAAIESGPDPAPCTENFRRAGRKLRTQYTGQNSSRRRTARPAIRWSASGPRPRCW